MSERSRDEKLAAAKEKLKKFQENTSKVKSYEAKASDNIKTKKIPQNSTVKLNDSKNNKKDHYKSGDNCSQNPIIPIDFGLSLDEPTATTESLKQISRHLNGIISCSSSSIDRESQQEYINTIRELEKRNVELASLNSQKAQQIEFMDSKIQNLNETIDRNTKEYNNDKNSQESLFKKQTESNRVQLQNQIQTISLLVAEKSDLQSQVAHNQKLSNQRFQEIEDLTNKLKTSRQKVGDLEKSLNEVKNACDRSEETNRNLSRQLDQTRNDFKKLKLERDDWVSEGSQLRTKVVAKTQEISNLELTLDDIKSELEMAQVQIQHLTNNQEGQYDSLCSKLKSTGLENMELVKELESIKLQLKQADSHNSRIEAQYRSYFEQMEENVKKSQTEIMTLTEMKNNLILQLEQMALRVNESNVNESIGNDKILHYENVIKTLEDDKSSLLENIQGIQRSNVTINEKYTGLLNNNEKLVKIVEELEEKNIDLIEKCKQLETNQVDYTQLLNELQSDKTALSRALSQNKYLKSQLAELQEAFVKVSSDNMDFSTQLQHENHVSKELASRLGEQEEELNDIRQSLLKKDEEISKLICTNQQIAEELLNLNNNFDNQSTQRSESHFNMVNKVVIENLQNELTNYQERINQLTTVNNNLEYQLSQNVNSVKVIDKDSQDINELILNLRQIEAERDELLFKCENLRLSEQKINSDIIDKFKEDEIDRNIIHDSDFQSYENLNLDLNEKLNQYSIENKQLIEKNAQLEHLVEQLESETDTIVDYINLYQNQRSLLKQKFNARDQLMSKLNHQKQLMENKLRQLEYSVRSVCQTDINCESKNCNQYQITADTYEQILNIVHELQKPCEFISAPTPDFNNGDSTHQNSDSTVVLSLNDLFDYHIIHCKCCVGKVIDL